VATPAPPAEESKAPTEASQTRLIVQRIETAGEDEARVFQEKAEKLSRSSSLPRQSNPPDNAKNFEGNKSLVEEHVKRLEDGLQACRSEMQQLGAELEELKHAVQDEMGKTLRQVQESRPKLVESAIRDLEMKVKEEVDSVADELIDLTQKRVQEEVAAALEPLIQGALERVRSVAEEQSVRAGEGIQDLLSRLIQEGQAQLARTLQLTTSEFQKEVHRTSGTTIACAQAEMAQAWSKSAVGFEAQLQETADKVVESAAKQLQKQAEDTLLLLGEELKTSGNDCTRRLEESLTKAEVEQQQGALSRFRKALEQQNAEALAGMKCDLAQALQDVTEQAARQASALNDLRKAVEEESLQTLANVKAAATQAIGEVSSQIERQVNALKELCGGVQEESAKTLAQAKREATPAIREVSKQAGRDVQAPSNLRNSLGEESAQPLPRFEQDLERVMGEVTDQVQQQVNMFCSLLNLIEKESAQVFAQVKNDVPQAPAENSILPKQHMGIQGKQQQTAAEILEAAAAQLGKQLEESLDLFSEELKLKQEQAASGAAKALRSKIVEMLSLVHSPLSSLAP
jgi:hypothetical protein